MSERVEHASSDYISTLSLVASQKWISVV